jgi:hypothetical protein
MHEIEHDYIFREILILPSYSGKSYADSYGKSYTCRIDAPYIYCTENRIPIRFAANRTPIRTGNRLLRGRLHVYEFVYESPYDSKYDLRTKPIGI